MSLEGILPVWKPQGLTSHDVVARVRRILKIKRIGHTGTLDPAVTGVLPLCIGRATRLVEYIQDLPKEYEACLRLGIATDTEDAGGEVTAREQGVGERLTPEETVSVISRFVGEIEQVPPMYSAVKVDGKRLYELARQGVEVERKARTVTIHSIRVLDTNWSVEYPEVRFLVRCSKGTYIRTLCVDIGRALGVPAVMAQLVRTSTGAIGPESCLTLEAIEELQRNGELEAKLLTLEQAVAHMPSVGLNPEQSFKALQGQKLHLDRLELRTQGSAVATDENIVAGFSADNKLLGIFEWNLELRLLTPVKIFS